jgi:hypothetical protein
LGTYLVKEKSPGSARNQRKLNLFCKRPSLDAIHVMQPSSPTSPGGQQPPPSPLGLKPKSILKKSNSNIEQGSVAGYVSPTNSLRSNSWISSNDQ